MTTPPSRPVLRERYDRRREQVVLRAARVFAERGYDQTSMQDLADAVGIAAGGLYHYFGSKEALLIGICDQLMDPLLEQAEELAARDRPPEQQLRELIGLWVEQVIARRDQMLVFQQERHVVERGTQWRAVRARRKRFERIVEEVLDRVDGAGHLHAVDRRLALSALLGMVNHTAQWYRERGRLSAAEIAQGYADLLLGPR